MKIDLYNDDCFKAIQDIEIDSVDLILTDPPYLIETEGGKKFLLEGNREVFNEIKDADIHEGIDVRKFLDSTLTLFSNKQKYCGIYFHSTKQIIDYISWAIDNDFQYNVGVWHKSNPIPLCGSKYLNDIEYWIYIKGNKSKILGSYASKSMVYSSTVNKDDKKKYNHPTIKPVELMEKFIINHTKEDYTVLDPFMGSGSTGVAAKNLNRNFIGIELNEVYFNTAKDRIESTAILSTMFG